jgi:biopolymer transport protein TolQ
VEFKDNNMGEELNLWKALWQAGPVVKMVLAILVVKSIYSWAIIWKKRNEFLVWEEEDEKFLSQFHSTQQLGNLYKEQAQEILNSDSTELKSPLRELFRSVHREFLTFYESAGPMDQRRELLKKHYIQFGFSSLDRAIKKASYQQNIFIEKGLTQLATIGTLSPFVGLFGTVWGIIHAFNLLAGQGASLEILAPGIAEALVTTAIGLFVAIPAVAFFNLFQKYTEKMQLKMESFSFEYLNRLERTYFLS